MGVRVGVDVGGTFTKAIAYDLGGGGVIAQAVVATTHTDPSGVAAGVVDVVRRVAEEVGPDRIDLVVHSTTQAVNALLEGDTAPVGVVGLGRRPELKKAQQRTQLRAVEVAAGRMLDTRPVFFDITDGVPEAEIAAALARLQEAGVGAVCVAEAFAPDDATGERRVAEVAAGLGLPACTSSELSGLFGLELRAVTAALNASVLPIAAFTAGFVADGVAAAGIHAPLLIMRGDGGATDLDGFRRAPARSLYSGPAASVAGALRFTDTADAVVVEVGGTSTNVAAIRHGLPSLRYVQIGRHVTAVRAVDVRVLGVAGGSMLRARKGKVYGVGPRSAHIAGLPYAAFEPAASFEGAVAVTFAPKAGDPDDYVAVDTADGRRFALTNTCAAVALEVTRPGDYAHADPAGALAAFAAAGRLLRLDGREVARRMLEASGTAVCELVAAVAADHDIPWPPPLVAVGGGAGGLGREAARMLRTVCTVPDGAEVISSIGDALSLIRSERERTCEPGDMAVIDVLVAEVEAEAVAAGAAPRSIEIRVEEQPEKGTVRAIATGAVALASGALPGRDAIDADHAARRAAEHGCERVEAVGGFWVAWSGAAGPGRAVVFDRWGDVVLDERSEVLLDPAADVAAAAVRRATRHRGPVVIEPTIWVASGNRFTEVASGDRAAAVAARLEATAGRVAVIVGNE